MGEFVTYDELKGPDLDAELWSPARLPLPTGEHVPLDPNAEVAVGEGEVRVTIPHFSLADDKFQSADSPKYLVFSTDQFELPADRPARFAVDLAVENIGGDPADYRRAMAAFHVFDLEVTRRVFAACGTSTRVLAMHEHLPLGGGGAGEHFQHLVESPYEDFDDDFTRLRECEITLDRGSSTAAWRVDGHTIYVAHGTPVPERARIRFGIWTMLPIRDGRSRSLDGQGMSARWRNFRVGGVDARDRCFQKGRRQPDDTPPSSRPAPCGRGESVGRSGEPNQHPTGRPDHRNADPLHDRLRRVHRLGAGGEGCVVRRLCVLDMHRRRRPGSFPLCGVPDPAAT